MFKRGQAEVWQISMIFEVVIALLLSVLIIGTALSYGSVSGFNKEYVKADLSLLAESATSAPGILKVTYPLSKDYKVSIDDGVKIEHEFSLSGIVDSSSLVIEKTHESGSIKVSRGSE